MMVAIQMISIFGKPKYCISYSLQQKKQHQKGYRLLEESCNNLWGIDSCNQISIQEQIMVMIICSLQLGRPQNQTLSAWANRKSVVLYLFFKPHF